MSAQKNREPLAGGSSEQSERHDTAKDSASSKTAQPRKWRDVLKIHPAAEMFPRMLSKELRELADDIKKNGLASGIDLFRDSTGMLYLLDGRNRADALAQLDIDACSRFV
jgi:hypothetical protein